MTKRRRQLRLIVKHLPKFAPYQSHSCDARSYQLNGSRIRGYKGLSRPCLEMKISPLLFTFSALVTAYNDVPYFMGITTRPEDLPDRIVCPKEFDHNTHTWKFLPYQWFDVLDALNEPKNVQRMGGDLVKLWLYREFDSYAMFSVKLGRTNGHHTAKFLYATGPIIQVSQEQQNLFAISLTNL